MVHQSISGILLIYRLYSKRIFVLFTILMLPFYINKLLTLDFITFAQCSATCGEGIQTRNVVCKGTDGSTNDKCLSSNKPEDWISCVLKPCLTGVKSTHFLIYIYIHIMFEIFLNQFNR